MKKYFCTLLFLFAFFIILMGPSGSSAWRRRRRRRRCYRQNCVLSSWTNSGSCSRTCGYGTILQTRSIRTYPRCGGTSCPSYYSSQRRRYVNCYTRCCPVSCLYSWNSWSACTGCGISTQSRTMRITRNPSCGGTSCPSTRRQTQSCNTGVCCPVNCVVNSWTGWGSCSAACESNGYQVRTRTVRTRASCGGTSCPTLRDTRSCRGPCCRKDCRVSSWTSWGSCTAPPGRCSVNSGTKRRTRSITRNPSCSGSACPHLTETSSCTPVPIRCQMGPWSSWTSCVPVNGNCGAGTQFQTRSVVTRPYCSAACPSTRQTRSCTHSCCPRDCVVSSWTGWGACSSTCGTGTETRRRQVSVQPSCNGRSCPSLTQTASCTRYINVDCVMTSWSAWSLCSNGCGNGTSTRQRSITTAAVCRGRPCGARTESRQCTDYREDRNCVVNSWGAWGNCSENCAVGFKLRTRSIRIPKRCRGRDCPLLRESSQCGTPNNGCQQRCSNGVCSCNPGYNLASNGKNCTEKDCKMPKPTYCAPGTSLGSTCKLAIVTCPAGKTTYPVTCSLSCPRDYSIKGASTVTCQTSGQWSSYAASYCRRNNDPPTQILLSGSSSVAENQPRGTKIGSFSSVDSNSNDRHTYSIVSGGAGKFELQGANLLTLTTFNYESSPNTFSLIIRSTDNGSPPMKLEKSFTISVADVNESPTTIELSSNSVDENSDVDTIVGMLSTADPDRGQTYSYTLLDSAGGRFKIQGNVLKVAKSNRNCLQNGGSHCWLNYESASSHNIRIRSADSGYPSQTINASFTINLNDQNDQPRGLQLSNYKVKENASINFKIGNLSASDEDRGQKLTFSLVDDDSGRFALDSKGTLYKAKSTDYETSKVHFITAKVTDNGKPALSMTKNFSISVVDVNEAPVYIILSSMSVSENLKVGTGVCNVTAMDSDAVQNLTFSLDDDAAGRFSFNNNASCQSLLNETRCTTELLVGGSINFEETASLEVIIRVTDDKGLFYTKWFNLTVIDVNDPPSNVTLDGSTSVSVRENIRNVQVDNLITDDEDQGQNFTYTLVSNPGGNFEIRGDKLFVSNSANLDFELSSRYKISVSSTDNGSPPMTATVSFYIDLQDVNEKPTNITLSNHRVQENKPTGTVIGQLDVTDPDGNQSHVCILTDSANGKVALSNNQLIVGSAEVNYEDASSFSVRVLCRDPGGLSVESWFVILVVDVNEAPTSITLTNDKVNENLRMGLEVAQINVTDPDNANSQVQTFSLSISSSDPNQPFAVRNDKLITTRVLDFENAAQWVIRVTARDNGMPALSRTQVFTIRVIDTNDAPSGIMISTSFVDENSDVDSLVGSLTALDQDNSQKHTFKLLNSSSGRFKVQGNQIKVAVSNKQCLELGGSFCVLNYEAQSSHVIRVKATDNGTPQQSCEKDLRIILRDVNDQPRNLQLSNNQVKENATNTTVIGRLTARDEDAGQSLTYTLTNDDSGRFSVDFQGRLYKAKDVDYETQNYHLISAMVQDNGNPSLAMNKSFTIEVLDVNEAPINITITSVGGQLNFSTGHAQIRENSVTGTKIGTVVALDSDKNQTLAFKLDDAAGGKFKLGNNTKCQNISNIPGVNTQCQIDFHSNGTLDYETAPVHYVTVRVTDHKGLATSQQLKISVVDENDPPENITLGGSHAASVSENSNGALVGQLTTVDPDTAQAHFYGLLDDAAGRFVIQNDKLYVSSSANLDYESHNQFRVKIQSNDSGSPCLSVTQNFQISVLDVNEAPTNVTLIPANVAENSAPRTLIGHLNITDPDNDGSRGAWQTHSCQVTGNQIGKFTIQSNLLTVGSAHLDYELASSISVQVKCYDSGSPVLFLEKNLDVTIDDVNEAPTGISISSDVVAENQSPSLIGFFSTSDPDNTNQPRDRQSFTYSLMGDTTGLPLLINGSALKSTTSLDYESHRSWNITVKSVDSGDPPLSALTSFQISVIDINEKPFNISLSNSFIDENPPLDTVIGIVSSRDPDRAQIHVYTLMDGAEGRFKLDGNRLKIALSNDDCLKNGGDFCKLNYENQKNYSVRIRATDNGNPPMSSEASLSITLKDINDRPYDFQLSSHTVKENATIGTSIGQFSAFEEDVSQTLQFSLIDDDNGRFALDSSDYLIKANGTDYETKKVHKIVAMVKDNGSLPLELNKTFIIVVENINEAPINISLTSASGQQTFPVDQGKVNENSPAGTTVGTLEALDHDEVQNLTYSLDIDAAGKFTVDSNVTCHNLTNMPGVKTKCTTLLKVSGLLDYETSAVENILVRVTDDSGLFHVRSYKIIIVNVNDRPSNISLAGGDTAYINENSNFGFIGELSTADDDVNQTHRYSLIDDAGWRFVLRTNKIYSSISANLNYEKKAAFSIVVRSRDNGYPALSVDKTFIIKVRDVNERPTDIMLSSASIQENSPPGTLVGKILVMDPDDKGPRGPWQNHFCTILNQANVPFVVNRTANSLVVARAFNYEKEKAYDVNLRCQDDGTPALSVDKMLRVNVKDVNEKPYDITLSNNEVAENAGIVTIGILDSADPDNERLVVQSFSYSLVDSQGSIPFVIDSNALNTTRSLDYEAQSIWILAIRSTDNHGLSKTKNFTIIVKDQNDPPTGVSTRGPLRVLENSLPGEYIGTVTTADQDSGQTHHYDIVDVVAQGYHSLILSGFINLFSVESPSGRVTLQRAGLDFEQYTNFTVTVNSTDSGFPPYTVTDSFEISVTNANEMPQRILLDNNQILENSPVGTVVGNLTVIDPDNLQIPLQQFNCVATDVGPFKVADFSTLVVSVNSLDYEKVDMYTVKVTCTELVPNPHSVSSLFFVSVVDVNEAPCNLSLSSQTIPENRPSGAEVGLFSVHDPDLLASGQANVTLFIIDQSPTPNTFKLVGNGLVTLRSLDFETQSLYNVTVIAVDSGNPPLNTSVTFSIQVLDTNDRPTYITLTSGEVYENATADTIIGTLRVQDQDADQSHYFSVIDRDTFYINGTSLLLINNTLDYESKQVYNVSVNCIDSGSPPLSIQQTLRISVLDSNDKPSFLNLTSSLATLENTLYKIVIPENSPSGTSLVNISVIDEDVGQQHSCMLLSGLHYFWIRSVTPSSSEVYVSPTADLDYERHFGAPISVSVECRDNGNPSYSIVENFSVEISDVNEAPFHIRLNASAVVQENVQVGYIIGDLTCKDPDIGQRHIFTVLGNYSSVFRVNDSGNLLLVKDPSFLDFENLYPATLLSVTIAARDVPNEHTTGPPLNVTNEVNITVIDVNEPPYNIRLIPEEFQIPENISIGSCIAQVTSTNPERSQQVVYTLLNYQDTFDLGNDCGGNSSTILNGMKNGAPYLKVISTLSYDHYIRQGYEILIEAEDNGIPPESFNDTVQINVTKLDPCKSSSCHANATCARVNWQNFTCTCLEGFTGDGFNCSDIDECINVTCSHGGTCLNLWNRYSCLCPSGYDNGTDCSLINYCSSNPCQHGDCAPYRNGYNCSCHSGYTGHNCETNIDDCSSHPCVHGRCLDGVHMFTCNCTGTDWFGTLCQRKLDECPCERCAESESQICIPPSVNHSSTLCISVDTVVSLDFPKEENTSSSYWQYRFEKFMKTIHFPRHIETSDEEDLTSSFEDVYIINPSLKPHTAKVDGCATVGSSTLDFIVIMKSGSKLVGLRVKDVLCGINNTCSAEGYIASEAAVLSPLCKSTASKLEYKRISNCHADEPGEPGEPNDLFSKGQRHFTKARLYYVIGGIGAVLLLVILTGLLLGRRNSLSEKKRKLIIQARERHRRDDDETYADIMYRHHMAHEDQADGQFDPLYGTTEEEVDRQTQVNMIDNPIYQKPERHATVKRSDSTMGFENPMYGTLKLGRTNEEEEEKKEEVEEEDKAIGFANPLFTCYREQKTAMDKIEADSAIYAEPTKPTKKSPDKHVYDTPTTPSKPIGQEPQVLEASGFFNPLYQTRQDLMQYPDISSIFATPSPPPDKQLDHEPGESSC